MKQRERNVRMFEAVIRGESYAAVGRAEGLSGTRVYQIVSRMCRIMLHPKSLGSDVKPDHVYWYIDELRRCSDFWLTQLAKLKAEWRRIGWLT